MKQYFLLGIIFLSSCSSSKKLELFCNNCNNNLGGSRRVEYDISKKGFKFVMTQLGTFSSQMQVNNCCKRKDSISISGYIYTHSSHGQWGIVALEHALLMSARDDNGIIHTLDTLAVSEGTPGSFSFTAKRGAFDYIFLMQSDTVAMAYFMNDFKKGASVPDTLPQNTEYFKSLNVPKR